MKRIGFGSRGALAAPAALLCAAALPFAAVLFGATTQIWELNGYPDFVHGQFSGLSITYDGQLTLGPALNTVFDTGQADIWSMAAAPDGSIYLGTGNRGRLYRVNAAGQGALVWTSDQPEIFAVAVDAKGVVYAGTSPDGKVYRIENGKAEEYFAPGARYIWSLAFAPDGALMVGTGDEGKIYRVTSSAASGAGQGTVYYETGQSHVTALAFDKQGRLLAGSEPNGIVYRITAPGRAFALYKSSLPEIHAIDPAPDGSVYVVAMGGGVSKRTSAASSAITSTSGDAGGAAISTTVTVTADQQDSLNPPAKVEAPKPVVSGIASAPAVSATATAGDTGGDKSALYRIQPDNSVETLWSSKDENIYDVALRGSDVLFLTDTQARIYRLESSGRATLVAQGGEADATRLLETNRGVLVATGSLGKLLRLDAGPDSKTGPNSRNDTPASGWYESPVHDAGAVAKWGRIAWHAGDSGEDAKGIAVRTRSGNSARPDSTWSDWSAPMTEPGKIASPNARYLQWRAELRGAGGVRPGLDDATVAYLPQNSPPVVKAIVATSVPSTNSRPVNPDAQTIGRGAGPQVQVTWVAEDPDNDKLIYALYVRGENEKQWTLLKSNLTDVTYGIDADALADGRYYFRVVASDRLSNPPETAREAELISPPVVVDNTPPSVTLRAGARSGNGLEITADAADRVSSLRRCEYSIDAGPWTPVEAEDGVTDSPQERFIIRIANLTPGEHMISVRVYDAAGNAGTAKLITP